MLSTPEVAGKHSIFIFFKVALNVTFANVGS